MSLAKNIGWNILGTGLQIPLQLLVFAVLMNHITKDEFGAMQVVILVNGIIMYFTVDGLSQYMIASRNIKSQDIVIGKQLILILTVLTIIFYLLIALVLQLFNIYLNVLPYLLLYIISIPFTYFNTIDTLRLSEEKNFLFLNKINLISYVIGYIFIGGISLFIFKLGGYTLAITTIGQTIASRLFFSQYFSKKEKIRLNIKNLRFRESTNLYKNAKQYSKLSILTYLINNVDQFIISFTMGTGALGLYERSMKMTNYFKIIVKPIIAALFPDLAQSHSNKRNLLFCKKIINYSAIVFIPLSGMAILLIPYIVTYILGNQWLEIIPIFTISIFGILFIVWNKLLKTVIIANNRIKSIIKLNTFYLIFTAISYFFISKWGLIALTYTVVTSNCIYFIGVLILLNKEIQFSFKRLLNILLFVHHPIILTIFITSVFKLIEKLLIQGYINDPQLFLYVIAGLSSWIYLVKISLHNEFIKTTYFTITNKIKNYV